jgi:hypothetical protein
MRGYWFKIIGGMALVFVVGLGVVTAARRGKTMVHQVANDEELTISLGSLVPFRIEGQDLGRLRSITLLRTPERKVRGVNLSIRTADSASMERIKTCRISVQDTGHIDPSSVFICLPSDSGYASFGEVRVTLRLGDNSYTHVSPLLLPEAVVQKIRVHGEQPLRLDLEAIKAEGRAITDSVKASELEREAQEARRRADSLRRERGTVPPAEKPATAPPQATPSIS